MKLVSALAASLALGSAVVAGCAGGRAGAHGEQPEVLATVVTVVPGEMVLRDVRKDAARYLTCQVPDISVAFERWAGSSGDVIVYGCGQAITYYMRCFASHHCQSTITATVAN
jgi:hypothetical protein